MATSIDKQLDDHLSAVEKLKTYASMIEQIAKSIVEAFKAGRRVYVLGNGGSAADAQHIAAELVGRFKQHDRPALPAMALTTDTSALTAISNDYGFEEVFARQVEALVREGDVVWALSVSGSSPNIIKAVKAAKRQAAKVIGFTGKEGAELRALCDICLMAEHTDSDRVQEVHQLAYHIVCGLIEDEFVSSSQ
ncbi:MAG: D-sedoheptulose 7-phosphate isomerase [Planctomycetes bacterium]|nr:D-sedoheptulose 7-phosphate isomerase [Planctomycetota bacterium]